MGTHWFRKLGIVLGMNMLGLLLAIPIGLATGAMILLEIFTGTVAESERQMLAGNLKAAKRELSGALFPRYLSQDRRQKYHTLKAVLSANSGDLSMATAQPPASLHLLDLDLHQASNLPGSSKGFFSYRTAECFL